MTKKIRKRMRNYIQENLAKGHSLEQIEDSLVLHGYPRKKAISIIHDYNHSKKRISNNLIAAIVIAFTIMISLGNYYIITQISITGMISRESRASGTAEFCINTPPKLNISDCRTRLNVSDAYSCIVNASDNNWNYTTMMFTYYDNTSLFNITWVSDFEAEIDFTSAYPDDSGGYESTGKNHSIELKVSDNSGCSSENVTQILNLYIRKGCSVKDPPRFHNLSYDYTIPRNLAWTHMVNATDIDYEDNITLTITEINHSPCQFEADCSFNNGDVMQFNSTSDLLTITPAIEHIGWHMLNISAKDTSGCDNDTTFRLVNITVDSNNAPPIYIGGSLDYSWNEDTTVYNAYDMDDFFNDSDGDCLKYEVDYSSCGTDCWLQIEIDNNYDPRGRPCLPHTVTLRPEANQFGTEMICFRANDTVDVSKSICANYTVKNVPELIDVPPGASTSAPGGGGGGGASMAISSRCEEKWYCDSWSRCIDGFMERNCTDINTCGTSKFKPNVTKSCEYIDHCYDNIQNFGEEGTDCGGECPKECATCFDAIKNCHVLDNGTQYCEKGIDCGGPCKPCKAEEIIDEEIEDEKEQPAPKQGPNILYYMGLIILLIIIIWMLIIYLRKQKKKQKPKKKKEKKKSWLSKIRSKIKSMKKQEPQIIEKQEQLTVNFDRIYRKAEHQKPDKTIHDLNSALRNWLKKRYHIPNNATYEEINKKLKGNTNAKIRKIINRLKDIEYGGLKLTKAQAKNLVKQTITATSKRRKKRSTNVTAVVFLALLLLSASFFALRPEITGLIIKDMGTDTVFINQTFSSTSVYDLPAEVISAIKLTGKLHRNSSASIYVGDNLVLDSSDIMPDRVKTSVDIDFNGSRLIDLNLEYNKDSQWDMDNDGIAGKDQIVDLTVKNTKFSHDYNKSKLCTLWQIDEEPICYGSFDCCSLLDLVPERDSWDDTLFLNYGKYSASEENIVSAKVIYANYSLDPKNSFSEVIESDTENISVSFGNYISFEEYCSTCTLHGQASGELSIHVKDGEIYLEKATYMTESGDPPEFKHIPNITIDKNDKYVIDLTKYIGVDNLIFNAHQPQNVRITIQEDKAVIVPKKGYTGKAFTFFTANDSIYKTASNMIEIDIRDIKEKTTQGKVRVGRPVRWIRYIEQPNKTIKIEHDPINITARKITGNSKQDISIDKIKIRDKPGRSIGTQSIDKEQEKEIIVEEQVKELELEYYTEAPTSYEENISETKKRITISSDVHYTNITAFTTIEDSPESSIKLYHIIDGTRQRTKFQSFDNDDDGLVDYIEWTVPHLSNQTYELEITVLDVQSYPTVGGQWQVRFTTTGTADLMIEAYNNTYYGNSLPDDLTPYELRCEDTILDFDWAADQATYDNYGCNGTGYWTVDVLTEGEHTQKFTFGNETSFAYNDASINSSGTNLTIWDDQDRDNQDKFASDQITFYANYTNGTQISNGACTIRFNYSGTAGWQDLDSMIYTDPSSPWNYTRNITYKGKNYYNIRCENSSLANLNVTDSITINNTKPYLNLTPGGMLPEMDYCIEDTVCEYNFSSQASDVDLNDVLTYTYDPETISSLSTPNCDNSEGQDCFSLDFSTGIITIDVDTSVEADNGPYSIGLFAKDSEGRYSDGGTLDIVIATVNDAPYFSIEDVSTCYQDQLCTLQWNVSDEEGDYPINFTLNYTVIEGDGATIRINRTESRMMLVNFTPDQSHVGNYTLNVTINDSRGALNFGLYDLTIENTNDPPSLEWVCNNSRSALEDTPFNCTVNATDPDLDEVLTFDARIQEGGSWFSINASSGYVNFTARNQHVGNYTINISVTDGQFTDSELINFTVNNTNDAPWLYNISDQTAVVDLEYIFYLVAYDDDFWQPDNTFHTGSENLTFGLNLSYFDISKHNATAAKINFTPAQDQKGDYIVRANVTDSENTTHSLNFNLTIRNNTAPIFDWLCNDSRIIQEEVQHICHVNATDLENDGFTFSVNASWFDLNSTTGNASFIVNDTEVGNHTLNFTVTDYWGWISSKLINFTVNNTPESPVWNLFNLPDATEDIRYEFDLSNNVSDEDMGDILTYHWNMTGILPDEALNHTTGMINYTFGNLYTGEYTVNFTVQDSFGLNSSAIVNFSIININDPPVLDYVCNNETSAVEDQLFNCTINATDIDGDTLLFSANASWFNITSLSDAAALVNFTPLNTHVGNHTINISVSDGSITDWQLINFTVNNTNDIPYFDPPLQAMNATEDHGFIYDINASDDDMLTPVGDTLIFDTNSTLFDINTISGIFNFTPNASQTGNYSILFNITDSAGAVNETIINFTILEFNDAPILEYIDNLTVYEGNAFQYDPNATDEEDGSDSSGLLTYSWNHTDGWFGLNSTSGIFNFTANLSMIGTYSLNITVSDSQGKTDSQVFWMTIEEQNIGPNITKVKPYGTPLNQSTVFDFANRTSFPDNLTSITLAENTTIVFNHTTTDENSDDLNSSWYKDGSLVYTAAHPNRSYSYDIDFTQAGKQNITLVVDDNRGGNDTFVWNLTINNTNRLPIFGMRGHSIYSDRKADYDDSTYGQFAGSTSDTQITDTGIKLDTQGSDYYTYGEFTSESIDIGPLVNSFYNPIGFTKISWQAQSPEGTNVTVQTRTSLNNVDWGNWSNLVINRSYTNSTEERIVSDNATYIQYKLILQTDDISLTPNVTAVKIEHILPDITLTQGDMNPNWIDLDDHFYELDQDDNITFSMSDISNIQLSLDNETHVVSITAPDDWYGTETVHFIANDSYSTVSSNNLSITVESSSQQSAVEYVYLTSTEEIIRTRTRTITEPKYLELLAPKHLTSFSDDTVVAPIVLKNNADAVLNNLQLSAETTTDLVDVWFSDDQFDTLSPGQTEELQLFIKWKGTIDEFDIRINATSTDPKYSDAAIISVTGISRVETNRSIQERHIEFVRDLLNNNPECLELTELLERARQSFDEGNYEKSKSTINFVIEGCRYLITTKKDTEQPSPIKPRDEDLYKLISGILLLLLFIATIIIIALRNKHRKLY